MKRYILFTLLYISTLIVYAANPEAEFGKIIKEYTFRNDGSIEMTYYKELKLNSQLAFNRLYGETFITYNPEFQKLKIDTSYTVQENGTIIHSPSNAFNEVLPADAANAPAYNQLKEMVVTHTGLETGATVYLKYTLSTSPGQSNEVDIDENLQEMSPVKNYVLILNIPAEKDLKYSLTGYSNSKPFITEKNGLKQYRWTLKNIPASPREAYLPQANNNCPHLIATTYTVQNEPLEDIIEKFSVSLNEAGESFTKELVKNDKTLANKIMTIQKYVVDQIATCPIRPELGGFKMRIPDEILNSSYGTEWEKTLLMHTMFKVINADPELVVIYPGTMKGAIKGLKAIKELKIKVNGNDNTPLFLSATSYPSETPELRGERDELWLISDQGIRPLNVIGNTGKIIYKAKIKIDTVKSYISADLILEGGIVPAMAEEETELYLKKLPAPGGKLITSEITSAKTHNAHLYYTTEQDVDNQNNYIVFDLPVINKGYKMWNIDMLNSSRKNFLEIPFPIKEIYEYELELSPELKLKTKESDIEIKYPVGSIHFSIRHEGGKIKIHRKLEINKSLITPCEYQNFRKIVNTWINPNTNQILLYSGK